MRKPVFTKLRLNVDTLRLLNIAEIGAAHGGQSGQICQNNSDLNRCGTPSLANTQCPACATDVDCASGAHCLSFEPGCA
jgi:hypothetical protein